MRVLVIGCHPDDETLGAGGTVIRHVNQGDDVSVFILTDGVGARHQRKEQQKECAEKACAILGVHDVVFCDLPDQGLDAMPLLDVIRPIEQRVNKFVPNIVYTHFAGDVNQDHRAAFQATTVACRSVASSPGGTSSLLRDGIFDRVGSALSRLFVHAERLRRYRGCARPEDRSYDRIRPYARERGQAISASAFL
nr:PIG-L family deacetylase [Actinomycetota bacterium]